MLFSVQELLKYAKTKEEFPVFCFGVWETVENWKKYTNILFPQELVIKDSKFTTEYSQIPIDLKAFPKDLFYFSDNAEEANRKLESLLSVNKRKDHEVLEVNAKEIFKNISNKSTLRRL